MFSHGQLGLALYAHIEMLREGDTLVVWTLDRPGRSVKQRVDPVGNLHKPGFQFRSLTDSIDTGTPSGRFFFHAMASRAGMERELTVERARAGLDIRWSILPVAPDTAQSKFLGGNDMQRFRGGFRGAPCRIEVINHLLCSESECAEGRVRIADDGDLISARHRIAQGAV